MSKCIYKDIASKLNKEEVENFYKTHLPKDVALHFGFDLIYFYRIFAYLGIKRRSASENTLILVAYYGMREHLSELNTGKKRGPHKPETIEKIRHSNQGKKKHATNTTFQKGRIPWNKGTTGLYKRSEQALEKYYQTMSERGWCIDSKVEISFYKELCDTYGCDDVIRQFRDKNRYPFRCDFYIKSLDLFIELNKHWTHGGHPFDENNPEDIKTLTKWQEKAKTSKFYQNAIYVWTKLDVKKLKIAEDNNLNYIVIY